MPEMLTTEEAACLFRCSTAKMKRMAVQYPNQLGAVKRTPRGVWLFPEDKAREALAKGLVEEVVAA